MTGVWLRRAADRERSHECETPNDGTTYRRASGHSGDIWWCGDCGRRWRVAHNPEGAYWVRRRLPWPRLPRPLFVEKGGKHPRRPAPIGEGSVLPPPGPGPERR